MNWLQRRLQLTATKFGCLTGMALLAIGNMAHAQVVPPPPPVIPPVIKPVITDTSTKPPVMRSGGLPVQIDTTKKKKSPADTIPQLGRDLILVTWDPPDSTMQELMKRQGYRRVQYQGDAMRFDSKTGALLLTGVPAAVQREETVLVGDTIIYNDSAKTVLARGDTVKLRDPSRPNADDIVAHGIISYDLASRSGALGSFSTSVEAGGQRLFLEAKGGEIFADSLVSGRHVVYASNGSFTYCDLAEPHFHFTTKQMKFVSQNIMVARPGVLYIGEVPVFWIPFFFQDVRSGRRSGLLTPNFGIAELLRNSPSYRRQVNNMGYFFALNEYMDGELSFDWRSDANANFGDRGFVRSNFDYRYRWVNRFITGRMSVERLVYASGNRNLSVSINHSQDFSKQTRFTSNLNWTQDTRIQQATTVNPIAANATILSQANFQTKVGPASMQLGGSRRQFPGRTQVETDFPTLTLSSATLGYRAFSWTPNGRIQVNSASGIDQQLQYPFLYTPRADGGTDSSRIKASRRRVNATLDSPLKLGNFVWQNSFLFTDDYAKYPEELLLQNVNNPADSSRRVFASRFQTNFDWNTSFGLPGFFHSTFKVSPSISLSNVDPLGGLFVRTTRSGGKWVGQSKRYSFVVSSSPTLYAQFPGIGPIARFRHTIAPSLSYTYSPASNVSDEFLAALGRFRKGYLGALAQNRVSLGMSTNLEGKLRTTDTVPNAQGRKINLVRLNFSALSWDFIRADTAGTGLVESQFSVSGGSDLLPGLDFRAGYSLFQGDPLSDTATFKPYRTDISTTFSLTGKSPIFGVLAKLFRLGGSAEIDTSEIGPRRNSVADDVAANQRRQMSAAGAGRRSQAVTVPQGTGWSLNLQYNSNRQRPVRGGKIIQSDPAALCESRKALGDAVYTQCVLDAINAGPTNANAFQPLGGPTYSSRATQNITSAMNFNVTRNWSAQWSTSYDLERKSFASQQVGLQRQLHDWTTTFAFNQSTNGAFSFSFFIALKAQPSLKFNYDRATYRSSSGL